MEEEEEEEEEEEKKEEEEEEKHPGWQELQVLQIHLFQLLPLLWQ